MRITNLLREKVFVFARNQEPSEIEREIIAEVCKHNACGDIKKIEYLDSNDHYDSFKVITDAGTFCIKVSLDTDSRVLDYEHAVMFQLMGRNMPYPIALETNKQFGVKCHLTSFIQAQNVNDASKSALAEEVPAFCASLHDLNQQKIECRSFFDYIANKYLKFDLSDIPEFKAIDFSEDAEILEIVTTEIVSLKETIQRKLMPTY